MGEKQASRIKSYQYIRSVACIGIIFIHVLTSGIAKYGALNSVGENTAYWSFLNCLKWGVPGFLMVSGMLLLDPEKKISYRRLFSRYVARILGALIVFGALFSLLEAVASAVRGEDGLHVFADSMGRVFAGNSWSHLWYLYCLIGLYLLLPLYKKIAEHCTQKDLQYLLAVYLIFLSVIPFLQGSGISLGFYIHVSSIYPFWFFYGYYMKKWGFRRKTGFYAGLLLLATAALVVLTVIRWTTSAEFLDRLFNYSSVLVVLQTTGLTGLLVRWKPRAGGLADRVLCRIDRHSFGIYLIHMIVIWLAYTQIDWNPFAHGGFFGVLLLAACSFFAALFADMGLRRLPVFRKIL